MTKSELPINQIIQGDCLEVMKTWPGACVDLVVTDPPYNFTTASAGAGKLNPWADICNSAFWFASWYAECMRLLNANGGLWTFCNWRTLPTITKALFDIGHHIESLMVWDKCWIGPGGSKGLRPSYEFVALVCKPGFKLPNRGLPDIQRFKWSSQKPTGHPAEKPIDLCKWILEVSEKKTVLDPFCGSGTTLAAAKLLGLNYVGIEMSADYWDLASERVNSIDTGVPAKEAMQGQAALFSPETSET